MTWPMDPAEKVVRDGSRLNKVLLVRLDPAILESADQGTSSGWGRRLLGDLSPHRLRGGQLVRRTPNSRMSMPQLSIRP